MKAKKAINTGFVSGLELARIFYEEAVAPILSNHLPDLEYSAALIGSGSEVLGFDDDISTDHHWGPRVMLFFSQSDLELKGQEINDLLSANLPHSIRGYPTNWTAPDPNDNGVQHLKQNENDMINHRVEMFTIRDYFMQYIGVEVDEKLSVVDWLTLPWQKLLSICSGQVFRDDFGLTKYRDYLSWYPHDVWLYILASCWSRIGQEEHLMGRAGLVGDDVGSSIIASRLVLDIMRLSFLMERVYPPYPKWFGSAFDKLSCANTLKPILENVLNASSWEERDTFLSMAYEKIGEIHNNLEVTSRLDCTPSSFWGRPFTVIHGERFAESLKNAIHDKEVRFIADKHLIGNIDLVSDNTDLLEDPARRKELMAIYR